MNPPLCPETGKPMQRGVSPVTLEYQGVQLTVEMPGWYSEASDEGIHTGEDLEVSDKALRQIKAIIEDRKRRRYRTLAEPVANRALGSAFAMMRYDPKEYPPRPLRTRAAA